MEKLDRSSNFELLRIFAMLMIVFYHLFMHGNGGNLINAPFSANKIVLWFIGSWGIIGVNVFVLISAFFLVDKEFKIVRIIRLYLCVIFYELVFGGWMEGFSVTIIIKSLLSPILSRYWFVSAFILMLIASPFMNSHIKNASNLNLKKLSIALFCIVFVYHTIYQNASIGKWAIFVGIYFITALIKRNINEALEISKKPITKIILVSFILVIFINVLFFNKIASENKALLEKYSPLMLILAMALFLHFYKYRFTNSLINKIGGLTLGVYIISENENLHDLLYGQLCFLNIEEGFFMFSFHFLIYGFTIFAISITLEYVRMKLFSTLTSLIGKSNVVKMIDNWFNSGIDFINTDKKIS